jgi:hypothetical protein
MKPEAFASMGTRVERSHLPVSVQQRSDVRMDPAGYSPSWTHMRHVASRHRLAGAAALGVELTDNVILPYPK